MGYKSKFEPAPFGVGASSSVAGDLYVNGEIYANSYHVDVVTKTITNIEQSGATKFGDTSDDLHQMTGTLSLSGSISGPFAPTDAHLQLEGTNPVISATGDDLGTSHLHIYSDAILYLGCRTSDATAIGRPVPPVDEFVTPISPIFIHSADQTISISGAMAYKSRESFTTFGTASHYVQIVGVDSTSLTPFEIKLPTAATIAGQVLIVKDEGGGCATTNVIINGSGSETIDGESSVTLDNNYESLNLYSNGTNWLIW
jgi:hypothetical protein